jgi:hypothetical protein
MTPFGGYTRGSVALSEMQTPWAWSTVATMDAIACICHHVARRL